jgi:2'-5' RNA ligase
MRTFIALDIDESIRQRIALFMDGVRGFAPDARWVRPESLHVTLKFVGERPEDTVAQIEKALASVNAERVQMSLQSYGFFPTPKSARVFWVGVEGGPQLSALARAVDETTGTVGIPQEEHPFSPHLTLARRAGGSGAPAWSKSDSPNQGFQRLQEKLGALPTPEFGTMTAREFFLYQSQTLRGGAQYAKIARFALA